MVQAANAQCRSDTRLVYAVSVCNVSRVAIRHMVADIIQGDATSSLESLDHAFQNACPTAAAAHQPSWLKVRQHCVLATAHEVETFHSKFIRTRHSKVNLQWWKSAVVQHSRPSWCHASWMSSITLGLHRPSQCTGPTIQQCFIYTLEGNVLDAINVLHRPT